MLVDIPLAITTDASGDVTVQAGTGSWRPGRLIAILLDRGTLDPASDFTISWDNFKVVETILTLTNAGTDLVSNGGFETAGGGGADVWANWTEAASDGALANETTLVHAGSDAAKITAGASLDTKVSQTLTVTPGYTYTLIFWTRGDGTYSGRYLVYDVSNSADIVAETDTGVTGTTYTVIEVTFVAPAGCTSVRLDLICPGTDTGIAYFDDVSVKGDGIWYPRRLVQDLAGADLTGTAGGDREPYIVPGRPKVVVAQGGNTKSGMVVFVMETTQ